MLNESARIHARLVGKEASPLLVIDDVLADPQSLIDQAMTADFTPPPHTHYPGLNAPLPESYYMTLVPALRPLLARVFGVPAETTLRFFGFFALATTPAHDAQAIQKIPHHDTPDPYQLAMVHYLCHGQGDNQGNNQGGTGFFRHRATGFESITLARFDAYMAHISPELAALPHDAPHAGANSPYHDLIDQAGLVFNRLIIYRSHVLHSALLGHANLSLDPQHGRLTANGFLKIHRPGDTLYD